MKPLPARLAIAAVAAVGALVVARGLGLPGAPPPGDLPPIETPADDDCDAAPCLVIAGAGDRRDVAPALLGSAARSVVAPADVLDGPLHVASDDGALDVTVVAVHEGRSAQTQDGEAWPGEPLDADALGETFAAIRAERPETTILALTAWRAVRRGFDPSQQQQQRAHAVVDAGADVFVGFGTPTMHKLERREGAWIVYSLGQLAPDKVFEAAPYAAILRIVRSELRLYPLDNSAGARPVEVAELGEVFWQIISKGRFVFEPRLKKHLRVGHDRSGRYLALLGGEGA